MDTKLILLKCILLLYWESKVDKPLDNSASLVRVILEATKPSEKEYNTDEGSEILAGLRNTAGWMCANGHTHQYDRTVLLSRVQVNCGDDNSLYNAFETAMVDTTDLRRVAVFKDEYLSDLLTFKDQLEVKKIIKRAFTDITYDSGNMDWVSYLAELKTNLEGYSGTSYTGSDAAIIDSVNIADVTTVASAVERGLTESGAEGIMPTRWQGINRMFGEYGGLRRGDFIVLGALQHNFKTGFTLEVFRQVAMYTTPYLRDPLKKPMVLHVSTENSVKDNILQLYTTLKAQETGERIDIPTLSAEAKERPEIYEEISIYVRDHLSKGGYHVEMLRVDPSLMTYQKLFTLLAKYEAQGFEISLLVIDYLNMFSKEGCVQGATGTDVRDLFRRVRNYCNPRGITVLTPHQISSEAKNILRNGTQCFVKEIANKGYWDGCRVIDQEVDMEILIHIEKVDGESYLTIHRGKHRKVGITPEEDLYVVYKFHPILGLPEDVGQADASRRKVGGGTAANGGGNAWFDYAA